jgi:CO dehydrogenase maturation factor
MTKTITIAGKGGTGKTTIAALLIELLSKLGTVLAIDADPSSNLHLALGLPLGQTVGSVREEMLAAVKSRSMEPGLAKQDYIELKVQESLVESKGKDLLAMGRPEGPGCYCAANSMLRTCIDRLANNYDYVVIDSEAGMEHISRQTTRDVDILLLVSDMSMRGIISAVRMKELIKELRTSVDRVALVINRADGELSVEIKQVLDEARLEIIGLLPVEPVIGELDSHGLPLVELPAHSKLRQAIAEVAQKLGLIS